MHVSILRLILTTVGLCLTGSSSTADGKLLIKPMSCYLAELHGISKWKLLNTADCAVGTFSCWHVNGTRPVPQFEKATSAQYYKADCGSCPAGEEGCVACDTANCNTGGAGTPRPYASVTQDVLEQLPELWSTKPSPFDPPPQVSSRRVSASQPDAAGHRIGAPSSSSIGAWLTFALVAPMVAGV